MSKPQAKPAPAVAEKLPLSEMYFIEGAKGKTVTEYAHVWAGDDEDKNGRTPECPGRTRAVQREYVGKLLASCRKLYPDVTFTLVLRGHTGEETEIEA